MHSTEQGSSEGELTKEERLEIAIYLASPYFQRLVDQVLEEIKKSEEFIRKQLKHADIMRTIDSDRSTLDEWRKYLRLAQGGKFTERVNEEEEDSSIHEFLKLNLKLGAKGIKKLQEGESKDSPEALEEVRKISEESAEEEAIVQAIEATDEFKRSQEK